MLGCKRLVDGLLHGVGHMNEPARTLENFRSIRKSSVYISELHIGARGVGHGGGMPASCIRCTMALTGSVAK